MSALTPAEMSCHPHRTWGPIGPPIQTNHRQCGCWDTHQDMMDEYGDTWTNVFIRTNRCEEHATN